MRVLLAGFAWTCCIGAFALAACGPRADYVWLRDVPEHSARMDGTYVIHAGDLLSIDVYNEPTVTSRLRVRVDGRITVPLLGEVQAQGKSPYALSVELAKLLGRFIRSPRVTVSVEEMTPPSITIVGQVRAPGVYPLGNDRGVIQALASAGGLTEFADKDDIYVLRREPRVRIRVDYNDLIANDPKAIKFQLVDGDIMNVE